MTDLLTLKPKTGTWSDRVLESLKVSKFFLKCVFFSLDAVFDYIYCLFRRFLVDNGQASNVACVLINVSCSNSISAQLFIIKILECLLSDQSNSNQKHLSRLNESNLNLGNKISSIFNQTILCITKVYFRYFFVHPSQVKACL